MQCLNDLQLKIGEYLTKPLVIGGMGVDISSDRLALEAARLGCIGHISDALVPTVCDNHYGTSYSKNKLEKYKYNKHSFDKSDIKFDLTEVFEATKLYVSKVMEKKKGVGKIFINCMEKLTMNNPRETLKARLEGAMEAGIDGITLSAGLHLSSFLLASQHRRFRDCKFGIIVSSLRALKIFLEKGKKVNRMPDYIVVEGPLAGGHLGFGLDWFRYKLKDIVKEIADFLKKYALPIPLIAAGGVFTGGDALAMIQNGANGVQVATRFTITNECGLPTRVKQEYITTQEDEVYVSSISPTGYPMRILRKSPALNSGIRPNCEALGYLLNSQSKCAYIDSYRKALELNEKRVSVKDKVCLCTHMKNFKVWTCGHNVYRLKDTTNKLNSGGYQLLSAEHVINDYLYSQNNIIQKPTLEEINLPKELEKQTSIALESTELKVAAT